MNDFELQRLLQPPLRKRAYGWKDFGRQALFTGAGAGTGALVNYLLGNTSLSSYLIGGGVGALGGFGLERALNGGKDTRSNAEKLIDEIESSGRTLTDDEKRAIYASTDGISLRGTATGGILGGGISLLAGKYLTPDSKDFGAKQFIEQFGAGGEEQLKALTSKFIKDNPNDPLVQALKKAPPRTSARIPPERTIAYNAVRERVANLNRNHGTTDFISAPMRWANKPGGPRILKAPIRFVGPRLAIPFAGLLAGFGFDLTNYLSNKFTASRARLGL